ncbi:MAG: phosphatidate cytidylyltransferase [Cyanobacteria bacterium P01_E01_bin.34]
MEIELGLVSQMACYVIWLAAVFGLAEWLRNRQFDGEAVRKVIHIGVGNIIVLAWLLDIPQMIAVAVSLLFSFVALLSYRIKILQSLNGVARDSYGTFFYAASIATLFALFWRPGLHAYAAIGVLVMTWGDALAALIGRRWGRRKYVVAGVTKSWEGSAVMWLISSIAIAAVLSASSLWMQEQPLGWGFVIFGALVIGAISAILEMLSWRGLDNITVPLASAGLSYWLIELSAIGH